MPVIDARCNAVVELDHSAELIESPVGRTFGLQNKQHQEIQTINPPAHSKLVIIGGGPIGVGIAVQLWHIADLRRSITILEQSSKLCGTFFERILTLKQKVMRSSYEHHLAPDGDLQMLDFARIHFKYLTYREKEQVRLALTGQRAVVPVDIFREHTLNIMKNYSLNTCSFSYDVMRIERTGDERPVWKIISRNNQVCTADFVILANASRPGNSSDALNNAKTLWPSRIMSAYSPAMVIDKRAITAIVGSGLSAAHLIHNICRDGRKVAWVIRGEERYRCADFSTSFFRTEGISAFRDLNDESKLQVLEMESRGSIMIELLQILSGYEEQGLLNVYRNNEVAEINEISNGEFELTLHDKQLLVVNYLVDASGLKPDLSLLPEQATILRGRYPKVYDNLEVVDCPNMFVCGVLASMQLGPAAKNIDGARLAAQVLVPALRKSLSTDQYEPGRAAFKIRGTAPITVPNVIAGIHA